MSSQSIANAAANSSSREISKSWLYWEILCNILLAAFFLRFVLLNGSDLLQGFRLSSLLILLKVSSDTIFHLFRRPARDISTTVYDWIIGIGGAYTAFFYLSTPGVDSLFWQIVQLTGMVLQVAGMLSLNRSIGFVAANRGIKTRGMYKFVRHPLYFAYVLSYFGFVMNQPTSWNLSVYAIMVTLLFMRAIAEERVLMRSKEYQEYSQRVRYRLIPYVL